MPWLEATPMEHRLQFVAEARRTDESFTALCARYGIAPKTGYKWLARYAAEGPGGLHERSRRPHTSPTATSPAVADALLALRHRHPTWGGKKLLAVLARRSPRLVLPAPSTVAALLTRRSRHGAATPPHARSPRPPDRGHGGAQRDLDRRLQGRVQDARRRVLLPAHDLRRLLALPARVSRAAVDGDRWRAARLRAPVPRARATRAHPERQRRAVRDHRARAALGALRLVAAARDPAGPDGAQLAPAERAARTDAPHAESGGDQARRGECGGAAARLRPLPARVQRRAPPRGAGPGDARELLHAVAAPVPAAPARARVPGALGGAPREPQRRRALGRRVGQREPRG